jgi:YYY domain-containing protein
VLASGGPFGEFDFWRSSRMMPPDPPGHEITEFPFFTFLFADLHPNLMAIPFALLALGLALAVVLAAARVRGGDPDSPGCHGWGLDEVSRLAALGVVVGAVRLINTWDYPTYLIVAASAITLAEYFRRGGLGLLVLVESGAKSLLVLVVGYLAFLPFHQNYETFFTSLDRTTNQTVLWQFLAISGLFIFIIGSFYVSESKHRLLRWWRVLRRLAGTLTGAAPRGREVALPDGGGRRTNPLLRLTLTLVALLSAFLVITTVSGLVGSTIPFLLALEALVIIATVRFMRSARADAPYLAFVAAIVAVSLTLAIGLDIFRVEGDIDRMNSIFKFYLQIWVMLALASAYLLWRLADGRRTPLRRLAGRKKVWLGALALLIAGVSIYPVLGTQDRLRDRFNDRVVLPMTLDGMAYMRDAVYGDVNGDIELYSDYQGIKWLQDNVRGSPVVLEGGTPIYRWGGRISVYTGLPSVLGWQWHQEQQRWGYRWAIGERADDVRTIYTTEDASEALALLRLYGVEYVYVGQLETLYYPRAGLDKFDDELKDYLKVVYENEHVRVYRVRQG